ncbi:THO complex subunit 2-like [Corythoichthys intestinalis]|uniref:THO complex subunit 2-like n=1 Tax=Corythoichthys intestinalis TaxID=161448 RepID=UPI0025A68BB4|nr:THO complex subunit 2-like [Corythoichthys intestinalis]
MVFIWDSIITPRKSNKETKSKKNKNQFNMKNNITPNMDDSNSNKISKFKDAMKSKKAKKEKKKKKKRIVDVNSLLGSSNFTPTFGSNPNMPFLSSLTKKHKSDRDSKKKRKRKKVAFELPYDYMRVKRPNFSCVHPKNLTDSSELKKACLKDGDNFSSVSEIVQHQSPQEDDNQMEDINSQDLFITQKTFRSPSSDSTADATYKPITTILPSTNVLHYSHQEKYLDVDSCQRLKKKKLKKTKNAKSAGKYESSLQKKTYSFQTEEEGLKRDRDHSGSPLRPCVMNHHMDERGIANGSPEVAKSKHSPIKKLKPTTSTSTQTENFFTAELSSYFAFSRRRMAASADGGKPLDLSLPHRARKNLGSCLYAKASVSEPSSGEIDEAPICSSAMKDVKVKKKVGVSDKKKGETTVSPLTESEFKSGDTTTSSECNEPSCRSKKMDRIQVRPVQTRLNESFFFKAKGDTSSPRSESPLLKLFQSRQIEKDVKGKKPT